MNTDRSHAPDVKESAQHIARSADATQRSADQTTVLAADRTLLAAERTYAAWVRTGLAALVSGVGAKALLTDVMAGWVVGIIASLLIVFSGLCFLAAVWRGLHQATPACTPRIQPMPSALLLGISAILIVIDVAALIGIWMARGSPA